jgi:hypothetical protein
VIYFKVSKVLQKDKKKTNSNTFSLNFNWWMSLFNSTLFYITFSCSDVIILHEIQNSEVNNAWNEIIVQKAITKSSVGQHGPPTNAKVGSGA